MPGNDLEHGCVAFTAEPAPECGQGRVRVVSLKPGLHIFSMPFLLSFMTSTYLEVVVGDVVVVGLHLAKRLLVVLHQVVDVEVFSFFDFMNVHLAGNRHEQNRRRCDAVSARLRSKQPAFKVGNTHAFRKTTLRAQYTRRTKSYPLRGKVSLSRVCVRRCWSEEDPTILDYCEYPAARTASRHITCSVPPDSREIGGVQCI